MTKSIEKCKEDIANKYLDDFKKELTFLEKLMIVPITKKMKEVLKSDKKINVDNLSELEDLGFWRKVLWVKIWDKQLFESLVTKIFLFLKEKQEKIIQAQASGNLEELLNNIINWKIDDLSQEVDSETWNQNQDGSANSQDNQDGGQWNNWNNGFSWDESQDGGVNPVAAWVATWIWWGAAYYEWISYAERKLWINRLKETPKEFDADQTKQMMENIRNQMKERLGNTEVKMNRVQKSTYNKSIKEFDKALESFDSETVDAFKEWQKISDRVPPDFLKNLKINKKILDMIDALPEDELIKIVWMDEKNIVKFFKWHWIDISEDFAKQLKLVKNVWEIKQITKIARSGRRLSNLIKWIKWMWLVTFLFMWFDVWCYFDSKSDAELVEKINEVRWKVLKDQAQMQLLIWLGSVGLEALTVFITCVAGWSMTWPWWTVVWVVVWVLAAVWSILYDRLYADKKAFYAQNRYDFINQTRTWIKQSIVQLLESNRLDMHESMKWSIKDDRWINSDIDTLEDAWEALIFQEECFEWEFEMLKQYYGCWEKEETFVSKLNDEQKEKYNEEKLYMEKLISFRMEYIKRYIKEDKNSPEYNKMKEALESKRWLIYIEQLLADSKIYSYIKQDNEDCYVDNYKDLDVEWYKVAYKEKLSQEYPKEFSIFEKLFKSNPWCVWEICEWVEASRVSLESNFELTDKGDGLWDEQVYSWSEIEIMKKNMNFISKYHEYISLWLPFEKKVEVQTSNSLDYAYIERILLDLSEIEQRPQWDKNSTLKYVCSYEYMDRNKDVESLVSNSIFQNILYSIAKEIHWYRWANDKLQLIEFYSWDGNTLWIYMDWKWRINEDWELDWTIDNPNSLSKNDILEKIVQQMELDSVVECADDSLNVEYRKRVTEIVNREFEYVEHKKNYEEKIINYINNHAVNGNSDYIELPQNLVIEWKKAWIWNIHQFLFRVDDWEIHALCRWDLSEKVLNFDKTNQKITFEATKKLRDWYSEEEKNLISMVDEIESKLLLIRWVEWDDLKSTKDDEFDIPVELERILSKKSIEWDNVKESILYMKPYSARDYLRESARNYYDYFNGVYMWILTKVTWKRNYLVNSNDVDDLEDFFSFFSPIWESVAYKENNEIKLWWFVDNTIWKYMLRLFDQYKDVDTWKTIKELLLSDNEFEEILWQEIAGELYKLCLEETTFEYAHGKLVDFTIRDMNDTVFAKVKEKANEIFSKKRFSVVFNDYINSDVVDVKNPQLRIIGYGEYYVHRWVELVTKEIIATMDNIDWAWKRKEPQFIVDETQTERWKVTWIFKSWWYSEKITIETSSKWALLINIPWLNQKFTDLEEGIRTANLINFIKNNIKENPKWSSARWWMWTLWEYMWYDWALDRNVSGVAGWFNYTILDSSTVEKYYHSIKDSAKFINYINWFMN